MMKNKRTVMYALDVTEEEMLDDWMHGRERPDDSRLKRLRVAYELVSQVAETDGEPTARAWFVGSPDDQLSPAAAIREGDYQLARDSAEDQINDVWPY